MPRAVENLVPAENTDSKVDISGGLGVGNRGRKKLRVPTNVIVWAGSINKMFPKTAFHMSPGYILAIRKAKNIHFKKKMSEVLLIHLPMCTALHWPPKPKFPFFQYFLFILVKHNNG